MVGKIAPSFPMIGQNFRQFSNDWKKFPREESERIFSHKGQRAQRKGGGRETGGSRESTGSVGILPAVKRMDYGREEKDKQDKREQDCGKEEGGKRAGVGREKEGAVQ
jgi:hypothetical protein